MFSITQGAATVAASAIHFTLRRSIIEEPTSLAQRAGTWGSVPKRSKACSETKTLISRAYRLGRRGPLDS